MIMYQKGERQEKRIFTNPSIKKPNYSLQHREIRLWLIHKSALKWNN
jgi:hypothetical protein